MVPESSLVFTSTRHWSLSWARYIPSTPSHSISLRSVLMLTTHLRLGHPSGLLYSVFQPKFRVHFSSLPAVTLHKVRTKHQSSSCLGKIRGWEMRRRVRSMGQTDTWLLWGNPLYLPSIIRSPVLQSSNHTHMHERLPEHPTSELLESERRGVTSRTSTLKWTSLGVIGTLKHQHWWIT
jgi:hypothetical protein